MMRTCPKCQEAKPLETSFYTNASNREGFHTVCKECVKADRRTRYAADPALYHERNRAWVGRNRERSLGYSRKLRTEALAAYGGRCACCCESTTEFLGIDHVNNDGEKHRRELKGYGRAIYQWLKREGYPQDGRFQVLCHNCNIAKGLYGGCPHQGPVPGRRRKTLALRGIAAEFMSSPEVAA
jgi:hypothetical protein